MIFSRNVSRGFATKFLLGGGLKNASPQISLTNSEEVRKCKLWVRVEKSPVKYHSVYKDATFNHCCISAVKLCTAAFPAQQSFIVLLETRFPFPSPASDDRE